MFYVSINISVHIHSSQLQSCLLWRTNMCQRLHMLILILDNWY